MPVPDKIKALLGEPVGDPKKVTLYQPQGCPVFLVEHRHGGWDLVTPLVRSLSMEKIEDALVTYITAPKPTEATKVRLTYSPVLSSGGRSGWARTVSAIDRGLEKTKAKSHTFVGDYIRAEVQVDLDLGSFYVEARPCGSAKNGWVEIRLMQVSLNDKNEVDPVQVGPWHNYKSQWLSFLDHVEASLRS